MRFKFWFILKFIYSIEDSYDKTITMKKLFKELIVLLLSRKYIVIIETYIRNFDIIDILNLILNEILWDYVGLCTRDKIKIYQNLNV